MADCPHGLDSDWCSVCLHGVSPMGNLKPTIESTFRAQYDGYCPGCNLPICAGEHVHLLSNDSYVHVGCEP